MICLRWFLSGIWSSAWCIRTGDPSATGCIPHRRDVEDAVPYGCGAVPFFTVGTSIARPRIRHECIRREANLAHCRDVGPSGCGAFGRVTRPLRGAFRVGGRARLVPTFSYCLLPHPYCLITFHFPLTTNHESLPTKTKSRHWPAFRYPADFVSIPSGVSMRRMSAPRPLSFSMMAS